MKLREYLKEHILIMDGAMATYYDACYSGNGGLVEEANLTDAHRILEIHSDYLARGASMIRTNTYAVNRSLALRRGLRKRDEQDAYLRQNIRAAWEIAEEAVRLSGQEAVWIAANLGPAPDELFSRDAQDEEEEYRLQIDTFLECGAEVFNFETFADSTRIVRAAAYIKERNPDAFIMASFAVNKNGYTSRGISMKHLFDEMADTPQIDCYGCNCLVGVFHMYELLKNQRLAPDKFIKVMPNGGYPQIVRGRARYAGGDPIYYGETCADIARLGVNILGGCCGTTPEHIRALKEFVGGHSPYERSRQTESEEPALSAKTRNNSFMEKLERGEKVIAVELDPPFDQNAEKLMEGAFLLKKHHADIITLADSPLARARADSVLLASRVHAMTELPVMPHIACRDRNRISLHSTLLGAHINGIRNLLLVTGDPVQAGDRGNTKSVFDFNSIRLMEYVTQLNTEQFGQDAVSFGGALNQNQANLDKVIERMQKKIDAGASWFLTQPVYSDEEVERLRVMKERLDTRILCGIMPLVSYRNAMFIKNEMPGIHVPDEVVERYRPDMSRSEAEAVAREISLEMIEKLRTVADGIYFMTPFNRVSLICDIIDAMGEWNG